MFTIEVVGPVGRLPKRVLQSERDTRYITFFAAMHLMYTLDENGNRVYTLKVCKPRLSETQVKLRIF